LTNLLNKDEKFIWNKAFIELRYLLCAEPLLQYFDFIKPFVPRIHLRDRKYIESRNGRKRFIYYNTSRLLNKAEQNYSTIEKEILVIIYSIQFFRLYIFRIGNLY